MNHKLGGCPSHKIGYTSAAKARKRLYHTKLATGQAKAVYECPLCGLWHMTKQRRVAA